MSNSSTKRRRASKQTHRIPVYEQKFNGLSEEEAAYQVDERSLDAIARYFGTCFEGKTEPMLVFVDLLRRLTNVSKGRERGAMVNVEDTVAFLSQRLFIACTEGEDAADKFAVVSETKSQTVLARFAQPRDVISV